MKKLAVVFAIFFVIVIAFALGFSKILSEGIVAGVKTYGPDVTQTTVTLDDVNLSAFSGSGSISGLVIGNPEGFNSEYAMKLGDFNMSLKPTSVISDKIIINEILIDAPEIIYETNSSFKTNIGQILKNVEQFTGPADETTPEVPEDDAPSKKLEIGLFRLSNVKVAVVNPLLGEDGLTLSLPVIELKDIGKGEEGATFAEVMKSVLASINTETIAAMSKSGGDLGKQVESATKTAKESVGNLLNGFKQSKED